YQTADGAGTTNAGSADAEGPSRRAIDLCVCGHSVGVHSMRGWCVGSLGNWVCSCLRFVPHPQPVSGAGRCGVAHGGLTCLLGTCGGVRLDGGLEEGDLRLQPEAESALAAEVP